METTYEEHCRSCVVYAHGGMRRPLFAARWEADRFTDFRGVY